MMKSGANQNVKDEENKFEFHLDPAHPVLCGEVSVTEVGHAWRLPGLRVGFLQISVLNFFVLQLLPW